MAMAATSSAAPSIIQRYAGESSNARPVKPGVSSKLAAESQRGLVHLINGCRGEGCLGDPEFGGDLVDRVLGDVKVHPTVGAEMRTDVALIVLLRFRTGHP